MGKPPSIAGQGTDVFFSSQKSQQQLPVKVTVRVPQGTLAEFDNIYAQVKSKKMSLTKNNFFVFALVNFIERYKKGEVDAGTL